MSNYEFTPEMTQIKKNHHNGWTATTMVPSQERPGRHWQITTSKNGSGSVNSYAQLGDYTPSEGGGFNSFSFMMFTDPSVRGASVKMRSTEKTIAEAHQKFLSGEFQSLVEAKFSKK